MTQLKRYYNKRQLVDYNNLLPLIGSDKIICMNDAVYQVIRVLLRDRGYWQSTYYKTLYEAGYDPPSMAELEPVFNEISEFLDEDMGCSEINDTLQDIEAILANLSLSGGGGGCGCGSGGAGGSDPPGSTTNTGTPGEQTGPPPTGFADWPEYNDYKCKVAHNIVSNQISDIQALQTLDIVALTALSLVAALLTPIPGDEVVALLALAVSLTAGGLLSNALSNIATAAATDYDDLVCALYNAEDLSTAIADYEAQIDTSIDSLGDDILDTWNSKMFWKLWVTNAAFNPLFDKDDHLDNTLPAGDCSDCGDCASTIEVGTGSFATWQFNSVLVGDHHEIIVCLGEIRQTALSLTGWTPYGASPSGTKDFRIASHCYICGDTPTTPYYDQYNSNTNPGSTVFDCKRVSVLSGTAFSLQL